MLIPLDLSKIFSTPTHDSDLGALRYVLMGGLDPTSFLIASVKPLSLEGLLDESTPEGYLAKAYQQLEECAGCVTAEVRTSLQAMLRGALSCRNSSREEFQLWYCLRSWGSFPGAGVAKNVLGVCMEGIVGDLHVVIYCDSNLSSFGLWEKGSGNFPWYNEGEASLLTKEVLGAATACLESLPVLDEIPAPPTSDQFLVTVLTPGGWRGVGVNVIDTEVGPVGICYEKFLRLQKLLFSSRVVESVSSVGGFDFEAPNWVYPSTSRRVGAFLIDVMVYLLGFFIIVYGTIALLPAVSPVGLTCMGLLGMALFPVFLAWFESSGTHTSLGKRMLNLYVVSGLSGGGINFSQGLVRNYCKCFFSPFFGWCWGLFHPYFRMYHDVMSDTVVIYDLEEKELIASLEEDLKALSEK